MDRKDYWNRILRRDPEQGLNDTTAKQRYAFVEEVLRGWPMVPCIVPTGWQGVRALLDDALNIVAVDGVWPEGQPRRINEEVVALMVDAGERPSANEDDRCMCLFGRWYGLTGLYRIQEKSDLITTAFEGIVNLSLEALRQDKREKTGKSFRLANALAANAVMLNSDELKKLINLIRWLTKNVPDPFDEPFLIDRVMIYDRMGMAKKTF